MAVYENNEAASRGQGIAAVTLSAITTGLVALGQNGGLGGIFGGTSSAQKEMQALAIENAVLKASQDTDKKLVEVYNALYKNDKEMTAKVDGINARVLALETSAPLKEQIVDQKIARVADSMSCCCNAANAAIARLNDTVGLITKTVVPKDVVCPEYMPRYNSWTAPTSVTAPEAAAAVAKA